MKKMSLIVLSLCLILLLSCQPEGQVKVTTSGVIRPITFGITPPHGDGKLANLSGTNLDLDEWDITTGGLPIALTITNHSRFPYTDINIKTRAIDQDDDERNTNIRYALNNGEVVGFPGQGGTCQRILAPGASCTIRMELIFSVQGLFEEELKLNFKNLVDPEEHKGTIKVFSGPPAKLQVTSGSSLVKFNEVNNPLISIPLVERTGGKTYRQSVTIKNVGSLRARKLEIIKPKDECTNLSGLECSPIFQDVYSSKVSCEGVSTLLPGESCQVDISYKPKNTAEILPEEFKDDEEITYRGNVQFSYFKNPNQHLSTLGINFESISSKIEGRLRTAQLVKLKKLVQGNRHSEEVIVRNTGYREARIKKLIFRHSGDVPWATCEHSGVPNSPLLSCTSSDEDFPFRVKDMDSCLERTKRTISINEGTFPDEVREKDITIGGVCKFILEFRPGSSEFFKASTDFTKSTYEGTQEINLSYEYDSQWRGGEDMCLGKGSEDCSLSPQLYYKTDLKSIIRDAVRFAAASLEVQTISFEDTIHPVSSNYSSLNPRPFSLYATFPLGDQIVMASKFRTSPNLFKRINIRFTNTGDAPAKITRIYTPLGTLGKEEIPLDGSLKLVLNDSFNCAVKTDYCFFRNVQTLGKCNLPIQPKETCEFVVHYAPFRIDEIENPCGTTELYNCAMFDQNSFNPNSIPFKSFVVEYENGVNFINKNGADSSEPLASVVESKIMLTANLLAAGRLMDLRLNSDNLPIENNGGKGMIWGSRLNYNLWMENIGAGSLGQLTLSEFQPNWLSNTPGPMPTPEHCSSNNPEKDCRCYTNAACGSDGLLKSEEKCFYPFTTYTLPDQYPIRNEPLFNQNLINGTYSYKVQVKKGDPALSFSASYNDCYGPGTTRTLKRETFTFSNSSVPAMIVPELTSNPTNQWTSSYLERFQFNHSDSPVSWSNSSRFFFRDTSGQSIELEQKSLFDFSRLIQDFINSIVQLPGTQTAQHRLSGLLSPPQDSLERDKAYYHFFMGYFPSYSSQQNINGELSLQNIGGVAAETMINVVSDSGPNSIQLLNGSVPITNFNPTINKSNSMVLKFGLPSINTCIPQDGSCLFKTEISITYKTGKQDKPGTSCTPTIVNNNRAPLEDQCDRTITLVVSAIVDVDPPQAPLSVTLRNIPVAQAASGGSFEDQGCESTPRSNTPSFNQTPVGNTTETATTIVGVRVSNTGSSFTYTKVLLTLRNESTTPILLSEFRLRSHTGMIPLAGNILGVYLGDKFPVNNPPNSCQPFIQNQSHCSDHITNPLGVGQSCYLLIRYQPLNTPINSLYLLSTGYHPVDSKPTYRNIFNVPLRLEVKTASTLLPANEKNHASSSMPRIIRLPNPTGKEIREQVWRYKLEGQVFSGNPTHSDYEVPLRTAGTEGASLLRQWQTTFPNRSGPTDSDFGDDNFTKLPIAEGDTPGFMEIRAHKNCFSFFIGNSSCSLKVRIIIKSEIPYRDEEATKDEYLNNNRFFANIRYFNLGTVSVATMPIFFQFPVRPKVIDDFNPLLKAVTSTPTATTFEVVTPSNTSGDPRGSVVGYRVYRYRMQADASSTLLYRQRTTTNNDFSVSDHYFPLTFGSITVSQTPNTSTVSEYFFYRIVAIRSLPNFSFGKSIFNLREDSHYISEFNSNNVKILSVLTPGQGTGIYDIEKKVMIDLTASDVPLTYIDSINWCKSRTAMRLRMNKTDVNPSPPKALLTEPVFMSIRPNDLPYWIQGPTSGYPFKGNCLPSWDNEQSFELEHCLRISLDVQAGQLVMGRIGDILNTPRLEAYVDPSYDEGIYARCYTPLPQ